MILIFYPNPNLDCNQIKIFINLEIIGEEDKNKKIICFLKNLKKNLHFDEAILRNHDF